MTQREIHIREIECALDFIRGGRPVVWSALRWAIDWIEADDKRRTVGETLPQQEGSK